MALFGVTPALSHIECQWEIRREIDIWDVCVLKRSSFLSKSCSVRLVFTSQTLC